PATIALVRAGLVVGLIAVAGVAFVVSWTALHDIGRAIGLADVGAVLYPLAADGPIALALVASLVLAGRHRAAALLVLGLYTVASLILNYVHGLMPLTGDRPRLSPVDQVHYGLVLIAASLPVGSIFFCADLVTRVLRSARPAVHSVNAEVKAVDIPMDTDKDVPAPRSRRAPRRRWGRNQATAPAAPVAAAVEAPAELPAPARVSAPVVPDSPRFTMICGAGETFRPEVPAAVVPVEPEPLDVRPEPQEPQADDTDALIERLWWEGELSVRRAADLVGVVSKSTIDNRWKALAADHGPRPAPGQPVPGPGQLAMAGVAA
ncbi:DUF2637 domain-containing protein, partial [Streptomyces sp. NPDC059152]|uniref:DUF2637 domain-containing protein n=1 Tax=Streptomyces sp. NPDC059152 TaxID=3346742 RepID=UPI003679C5CF